MIFGLFEKITYRYNVPNRSPIVRPLEFQVVVLFCGFAGQANLTSLCTLVFLVHHIICPCSKERINSGLDLG